MRFRETKIKGLWIIEPKILDDSRGFFMEMYNKKVFQANGIPDEFVQDNMSRSAKGTLRGLHYQLSPYAQAKLVRVVRGVVFDVSVDIRIGSPTFGQWFGYTLTGENRHALYIPVGMAHGFCVLSEGTEFTYKCTAFYRPEAERTILWNDPRIGIRWPIEPNPDCISE
ncbi:MAG: dTDP-4-dehydrorhamnose 3,5-epimerase, partial [Candidatus Omnitrophica bacterium]|nr:dTDP-4-dehydrorhamnose 3,5-epimerase [Candidatus Omnitrophota bacterium]